MMNWFKKKEDFTFFDWYGGVFENPILKVKKSADVKPDWWQEQKELFGEVKFAKCPGMLDYFSAGWIIPAWCDIHIKSNASGQVVKASIDRHGRPMDIPALNPVPMEPAVTENVVDFNIVPRQHKMQAPWGIRSRNGLSGILMPAIYHNKKLQNLVVFPGVVDYQQYDSVNFIFSVAKPDVDIIIYAGEPLIQVIPFPVGKELTATVGAATHHEKNKHKAQIPQSLRNFYRKHFYIRKKYKIEDRSGKCPFTS